MPLPAATGYSITRSLREAPATARAVELALQEQPSSAAAVRYVWEALWTQERRRQVCARGAAASPSRQRQQERQLPASVPFTWLSTTASAAPPPDRAPFLLLSLPAPLQTSFQVFGMELLCQLDTGSTADFFTTFFRLPHSFWRGFLASKLSSGAPRHLAATPCQPCSGGWSNLLLLYRARHFSLLLLTLTFPPVPDPRPALQWTCSALRC